MPVRIGKLQCRVTVSKGKGKQSPLQQPERAAKPSMLFAVAPSQPRDEVAMPEPSATASEERGHAAEGKAAPNIGQADARAVSDRVYELMKEELLRARERGAGRQKG